MSSRQLKSHARSPRLASLIPDSFEESNNGGGPSSLEMYEYEVQEDSLAGDQSKGQGRSEGCEGPYDCLPKTQIR